MPRRGPFPNTEKQMYEVLIRLPRDEGIGFNELWRKLKSEGVGMSFSTLTKRLRKMSDEGHVGVIIQEKAAKIPKHLYHKTASGSRLQQYLENKLSLQRFPTKRIISVHQGKIKYDGIIFGEVPYTYEIELDARGLSKKKEKDISEFIGVVSETIVSTVAERLYNASSGFISLLGDGKTEEAVEHLKRSLSFSLRMTLAFDGRRKDFQRMWDAMLKREDELSRVVSAVRTPTYGELLGCLILALFTPFIPRDKFPYKLSTMKGWARLITDFSNRWRKEKKVPLLEEEEVLRYLTEQEQKGYLTIRRLRVETGILEFAKKMPEPKPEEIYSFLLNFLSGLKSLTESQDKQAIIRN